jgi:ATP-dependent protease ClpP protease subunit
MFKKKSTPTKPSRKLLYLDESISKECVKALQKEIFEIINNSSDIITLVVHSSGGDIDAVLNLYYFIKREVPLNRLEILFEFSGSAANIILSLPHKKICFPHSSWYYHQFETTLTLSDKNTEMYLKDSERFDELVWNIQKDIVTREEVKERHELYLYPPDLIKKGVNIEIYENSVKS